MTDSRNFRLCLARFSTGVTVVTCADDAGHPYGVTANSFSSVSLEPPLVLWNIAKVTKSLQSYLNAEHFVINILSADQQSVSSHFSKSEHHIFDGIDYSTNAQGAPVLPGTIATLECCTDAIHDCGDHYIIVGEVMDYRYDDGEPLVFFGGKYRGLEAITD